MIISLTEPERAIVLEALAALVRRQAMIADNHPAFSAYGRVAGGDNMTPDEARKAFGVDWYVSPTGRRYTSRPDSERPVTPRQYDEATNEALIARGRAACPLSRTAKRLAAAQNK